MAGASDEIVISGIGMVSCLGLDAVTSCAAARAGIARGEELEGFDVFAPEIDPFANTAVAGKPILGFTEGYAGKGRLVRMGAHALDNLTDDSDVFQKNTARVGLYVALSSTFYEDQAALKYRERLEEEEVEPESDEDYTKPVVEPQNDRRRQELSTTLIPALVSAMARDITFVERRTWFVDHPGVLELMAQAMATLRERRLDACVVGGMDSLLEHSTLESLAACEILKTPDSADGVVPGEAAAFILLERREAVVKRGSSILGIVESAVSDQEKAGPFSAARQDGSGLASAIASAVEFTPSHEEAINLIIAGMNGTLQTARDWGMAQLRMPPALRGVQVWVPAVAFGDTGAASAAVSIVVALRAFERAYAQSDQVLIWAVGPQGRKAAAVLRKP